jgi:hypothetical protein
MPLHKDDTHKKNGITSALTGTCFCITGVTVSAGEAICSFPGACSGEDCVFILVVLFFTCNYNNH